MGKENFTIKMEVILIVIQVCMMANGILTVWRDLESYTINLVSQLIKDNG